ncbi:MAG: hypothetical protein ACLPID_12540 [Beijerinckiaceae bacterium]
MRPSRSEASDTSIVTMGDVAERLGVELASLAQAVHHLQGLISPLILEAAARNPSHLHDLQEFDHIVQKLGNLGIFLTTLSTHVPAEWRVDPTTASQVVTLSRLSSHLGFANDSKTAANHASGDFELF